MVIKPKVPLLLIALSITAVACGGGGGSGGNDDDNAGTPTERPDGIGLELTPDMLNEKRAPVDSLQDFDDVLDVYSGAEQTYLAIDQIRQEARGFNQVSSRTENTVALHCDNRGSGTLTVTLNQEAQTDFTWEFRNCQLTTDELGTILLDGTYTYVNESRETATESTDDGFQIVDLTGRIVTGNVPIAMQGADYWVVTTPLVAGSGPRTELYTTDALEFLRGEDYKAVTNAETRLVSEGGLTEVTIASRLIGSEILGFVEISTMTDIVRASGGGCPTVGVVRIVGDPENSGVEIQYGGSIDDSVSGVTRATVSRVDPEALLDDYDETECRDLIF